jgi:conjugal transfer pilus assembly protein TraW
MEELMLFIKKTFLFLFLLSFNVYAIDMNDIRKQAESIEKNSNEFMLSDEAKKIQDSALIYNDNSKIRDIDRKISEDIKNIAIAKNEENFGIDKKNNANFSYSDNLIIFMTWNMSEGDFESILEQAEKINAIVLFRGMHKEDESISATFKRFMVYRKKFPNLRVAIDPKRFKEYNVESAPYFVYDSTKHNKVFSVKGMVSPAMILEEIEERNGARIDSLKGPVVAIEEKDILDVIKERMAKIDWEEKKKAAHDRYWSKNSNMLADLPKATKYREREVDLTVKVTKDQLINGKVYAPAGLEVNPFDQMSLNSTLYVINPFDFEQLVLAKRMAKKAKTAKVKFILNNIDKDNGWEHIGNLYKYLGINTYLLYPDMVERFKIEKTPSVIYQNGKKLKVDELYTKDYSFTVEELREAESTTKWKNK